ncbi:EndoU domain-containing protein [Nostoc linckia FACHB-104]|nr:EndoU domain-containing protein [Nostoc linckia FACHB-104]
MVQTSQKLSQQEAQAKADQISLSIGLSPAQAGFAVKPVTVDPVIRAKFNHIYNYEWVQAKRSSAYYWNGDPASSLVKEWLSFSSAVHYRLGEKQGDKVGSQIRWLLLEKYNQFIKPELSKRLAKQNFSSAIKSKYLEVAQMATHLSGIIPQLVDSGSLNRSSQERANLEVLKNKEITLQKAALDLSVLLYEQQLEIYKQQGNNNGLNQVYYALESLKRDYKSKGERTLLPTENIGGGGNFLLPSSGFLSSNARFYLPYSTQDQVKAAVNQYRYRTVMPKLIDKATATVLYMEQVRGLSRGESFNYLMSELGLDLLLGVTDVPTTGVRKALATIPETELRAAVKRTSNPAKAAQLVDDIKRVSRSGVSAKKGGTGSSSLADDVDKVRSRTNSTSPCVASSGSTGFVGIATDTPTMEFFSGNLIAALPADVVALTRCTSTQRQVLAEIDTEIQAVASSVSTLSKSELEHVIKGEVNIGTKTTGLHHFDTLKKLNQVGLIDLLDLQGKKISINTARRMVNNLERIKVRYNNSGISAPKTLFPDNFTMQDIANIGETIKLNLANKIPTMGGNPPYYDIVYKGTKLKIGFASKSGNLTTWFPMPVR